MYTNQCTMVDATHEQPSVLVPENKKDLPFIVTAFCLVLLRSKV